MTRSVVRRVGAVAVAALAVFVVAAFAATREAGDGTPAVEGDGISVSAPLSGDPSDLGASGGGAGPGPDGGGVPAGVANATETPSGESTSILRIPDVRITFSAMIAQAGANPTFSYRAAVEARDGAQYALARDLFDLVARSGGRLAPFAEFRAAQMVTLEGSSDEANGGDSTEAAADRYAALLGPDGAAEDLPVSVRAIAITEGASALEEAGREADALAVLEQVEALGVGSTARAQALWERARISEAAGVPGWQDLAVQAMTLEPGSSAARDALDLLDEYGESYPRLVAAYVAYRGFRNDDAVARYEALLDEGVLDAAEVGEAWFYLGALRERVFDGEGAIDAYATSLLLTPDGSFADDARYWRGRVLEELGRPEDATAEYDRLVEDFPASTFAEEGRLRAAVALGLAGMGADSTARLAEITRTASPSTAAEAAHWHDVLVALFDAPPADLAPAAAYDPTSYAAAFDLSGEAVVGPLPSDALAEVPQPVEDDRVPIDVWIASALEAERAVESPVLEDPDVELAWLLAEAGEPEVARGLVNGELFSRRDEPYELVGLAYEAKRRGLHDVAMNAGNVILGQVSPADRLAAPPELLTLAYPVPYLSDALGASEEFDVPVLLLYALMRQESAFNPTAGSSAGAFGLTQVILPTGEAIASELGVEGWTFEDLAVPSVATRFGAYYLAVQLEQFDGHMLAALSAYNGGPGNASRWLEGQSFSGPDGYLYSVDFTETRAYLELVSENYAMYRYIYAGTDIPRLPHGE